MTDMTTLAKCPFCGGEAAVTCDSGTRIWKCECAWCGAKAGELETPKRAIAWWNTRPREAELSALLAETEEALRNVFSCAEYWYFRANQAEKPGNYNPTSNFGRATAVLAKLEAARHG